MAIISIDDILAEGIDSETLIKITDKENLGIVNEVAVNGKIAGVCGSIEDLLRARYTIPLNPVPAIIRDIAIKQSVYEIYGLNQNFPRPESVKDDYSNATKLLTKISTGDIKLSAPDTAGSLVTTPGAAFISSSPRLMGRDRLRDC